MNKQLYEHEPHWYRPRNANEIHAQEQKQGKFNQKIAVKMTYVFSSMFTFWLIMFIVTIWIVLNAFPIAWDPAPWPLLLCLASVPQLPLMVVIMVGQGVLSRKQEIQSEEAYHTTLKIEHELAEMTNHLHVQDERLLQMLSLVVQIQPDKPVRIAQKEEAA